MMQSKLRVVLPTARIPATSTWQKSSKMEQQISVPLSSFPTITDDQTRSVNPALILVDINTATIEQLDTLPEIGPITAQDIIDYRTTNGPFAKIEDILDVPGIGQVKFNKIKDLITAEPSP